MQHSLENELEELQVETRRKDEETKTVRRKFADFAKTHNHCDKDRKELVEKY